MADTDTLAPDSAPTLGTNVPPAGLAGLGVGGPQSPPPPPQPISPNSPNVTQDTGPGANINANLPPPGVGNHRNLAAMLTGLGVATSAFGTAIATHGREGGAPAVAAYQEQVQTERLREQANERSQADFASIQKARTAQTNMETFGLYAAQAKLPGELAQQDADLQAKTVELLQKAGVPVTVIPHIAGQGLATHSTAVHNAMQNGGTGGSTQNVAIPDPANNTTLVAKSSDLGSTTLGTDDVTTWKNTLSGRIDLLAAAGADPKVVEAAKAKLGVLNNAGPQTVDTMLTLQNKILLPVTNSASVVETARKTAKEVAETASAVTAADPVTKLATPEALASPGAKAAIQGKIDDPSTKPEDKARLQALLPKADVAALGVLAQKNREAIAQQTIDQGSPEAMGQLLANHSVTMDELKTRKTTPDFIAKSVIAAQKIDPSFKAPEAAAQAKIAANPANQAFFGNTDSLLIKGGTLDQVATASKNLPTGQIPIFNTPANLASEAAGQGATAAYAAAVLGVSDDYAKVMGGSIGTDTARQQVLARLNAAQSPEQIQAVINQFRQQINSQRDGRLGSNPYLRDTYPAPPQAEQYASAPGKPRLVSTDGGKTWQPAPVQ